jgi:hypothetical protein
VGAELWSARSTETDYIVTLTLAGDPDHIRPRLVEALERLDYQVLSEQPLHAKRGAQGSARWDCSLEVVDYPTALTINLKQLNDLATSATFNYEIRSYMGMTNGDRQTLEREAQALVAIAMQRQAVSACSECATVVTDDSRFCRRCGAPLVVDVPELEVLRITKYGRAAYHSLVLGALTLLTAAFLLLPLFWVEGPKLFRALIWLGSFAGIFGLYCTMGGIWDLHPTLNPKVEKQLKPTPRSLVTATRAALPASFVQPSVTEGTTELLSPETKDKVAEPVRRTALDTADIDDQPSYDFLVSSLAATTGTPAKP